MMQRTVHAAYARSLIEQERHQQDAKWGGPVHDDLHTPEEWRIFIAERLAKTLDHLPLESDVAGRAIQEDVWWVDAGSDAHECGWRIESVQDGLRFIHDHYTLLAEEGDD